MSAAYYAQVGLALLVFIGVLYVAVKVSKSVKDKKFTGEIEILDRAPVSQNTALLLVKARDKELLIGVTDKSIEVIERF